MRTSLHSLTCLLIYQLTSTLVHIGQAWDASHDMICKELFYVKATPTSVYCSGQLATCKDMSEHTG